jgi:hypothetical protein
MRMMIKGYKKNQKILDTLNKGKKYIKNLKT